VPTPAALADSGMELAFNEEFDGKLDKRKWDTCYHYGDPDGCTNYWNSEVQWYLPEQVTTENGRLKLEIERKQFVSQTRGTFAYRSGMVTTRPGYAFQYGYVEIAADYPTGQGLWPALWMLPAASDSPEIDIMEVISREPDKVNFNVHFSDALAITEGGQRRTSGPGSADLPGLSSGMHTFGVDWRADRIDWYVDGQLHHSFTDRSRIPHEPMYLIANVASGGSWAGSPDGTTPLPATMEIDYVRVWR